MEYIKKLHNIDPTSSSVSWPDAPQ
ncbi:hypothetical protein EWJ44_08950 [Salmonella enterica subsp. enterica serovar Newport]|uniref:Uncharacterized protein n=3 Tax=Salmonella enterica TaxID=28901 RepID=A0A3Z3HQS0_SALMU|nr:hypothetical protein [Salmonella enterica subsp. enterica serovar Newport]EAA3203189.1 hypothetical protein [Salmonella enterica subsp. enterica serovar Hadar]EAA5433342.1 hypothetical protein [Salmonella enterica subsp. enterica serovar Muenchen]EAB5958552.1 hypothetical protein [Salmonella enterica subsp. enterica serovar Manchester]EAM6634086.1 hypothetical protein [Salmonella enterica]EAW1743254.1 hypothetical protein [Salmonella enterica subsp. enterica]EBF8120659.1 hypothetical prote